MLQRGIEQGSRAADPRGAGFVRPFLTREIFAALDRLRPIASDLGLTLGQLALAWVLRRPEVTSAIIGATTLGQVDEDVAAADVDLDEATLHAIERALV
jgi:aryl-alcohol dehydrogenase-like predicted oxidoreductase